MAADRPPYWRWELDRWKLMVTALLILVVLIGLSRGWQAAPPTFIIPTFTAPAPGAQLPAAAPGDVIGSAGPGDTVRIFAGDVLLGETQADAAGAFRFTLPALAAGEHKLLARTFGPEGVLLATSAPLKITALGEVAAVPAAPRATEPAAPGPRTTPTPLAPPATALAGVQATPPTPPVAPAVSPTPTAPVTSPAPPSPSFTSLTDGAVLVSSELIVVGGMAAPDMQIRILERAVAAVAAETVAEANADAAGHWQVDLSALASGLHTLLVTAQDAEGNQVSAAAPITFTVLALDRPAFAQPATPLVLVENTPVEIRGTATAGATVRLFAVDQPLGDAATGPAGIWRVLLPGLAPGEHTLTVGALYGDGKLLMAVAPLVITVLPLEAQPVLIHPAEGSRVHSCQPLFLGHALPGRVVSIYDLQVLLGHVLPEADGRWALRPNTPLALGPHTMTVVAVVDAEGHALRSRPVTFRVEAPAGPCLQPGRVAPVLESPAPGSAVSSDRPLLLGTATPNSVLRIYDAVQFLGEAEADADGRWSFRLDLPLTPGRHRLTLVPMEGHSKEGNPRTQLDLEILAP